MSNVISLKSMIARPMDFYSFAPRYRRFLGNVPRSKQFTCLVHGEQGTGKSTFCLQAGMELVRFGEVLYYPAEEGIDSGTIQIRAQTLGIASERIHFVRGGYDEYLKELATGKYTFTFCDSVNRAYKGATATAVIAIAKDFPSTSFFFVAQSVKKGGYRGTADAGHDVDIEIQTIKRRDKTTGKDVHEAYNVKSRYAPKENYFYIF